MTVSHLDVLVNADTRTHALALVWRLAANATEIGGVVEFLKALEILAALECEWLDGQLRIEFRAATIGVVVDVFERSGTRTVQSFPRLTLGASFGVVEAAAARTLGSLGALAPSVSEDALVFEERHRRRWTEPEALDALRTADHAAETPER